MREILFRGRRTDNGEWVEGIYTPCGWDIYGERTPEPNIMIISENGKEDGLWVEIIHETVGQYTGVTDKNGKKIFEGDIVKSPQCLYAVEWNNAKAMFCLRDPASKVSYDFFSYFGDYLTVIGNIHDNPELLGGDAP